MKHDLRESDRQRKILLYYDTNTIYARIVISRVVCLSGASCALSAIPTDTLQYQRLTDIRIYYFVFARSLYQ